MIVTLKRHLVYKKVTKIYIYVVTKNHGFCKILIARYQYIKCEVMYDTVYIFFKGNQTKQNLRPFVGSQTCQVI